MDIDKEELDLAIKSLTAKLKRSFGRVGNTGDPVVTLSAFEVQAILNLLTETQQELKNSTKS